MPGDARRAVRPLAPAVPALRRGREHRHRASGRSSRRRGARRSPTCRRCPTRRPRRRRRAGRCSAAAPACRRPRRRGSRAGSGRRRRRPGREPGRHAARRAGDRVPAATAASAGLTVSFAVPAGATAAAIRVLRPHGERLVLLGAAIRPRQAPPQPLSRSTARGSAQELRPSPRHRRDPPAPGQRQSGAPRRAVVRIVERLGLGPSRQQREALVLEPRVARDVAPDPAGGAKGARRPRFRELDLRDDVQARRGQPP